MVAQLRRDVKSSLGSGIIYHSAGAVWSLEACYARLNEWVASALDMYRHELSALLYPLFVRIYLELVEKGLSDEAARFMTAHRAHFADAEAELLQLASVTTAAHMRDSELARAYTSAAVELRLSAFSFELLVSFIQSEQLLPLLQLLNSDRFNVVISRRAPALGEGGELRSSSTAPALFGELDALNGQPAVLDGLAELHAEHERLRSAHEAAQTAAGASAGSGTPAGKRARTAGAARTPALAPSRIPLPAWSERVEAEVVQDALHRLPLSAAALPSCCMLTYLHTAHAPVNAVAFSADGSAVASAHADSTLSLAMLRQLRERQAGAEAEAETSRSDEGVRSLVGHSGPVYAASFSRCGRFLLSASQDGTARLWSAGEGSRLHSECLVCYRGHAFPVWDVAFSPLGYHFATGGHDSTARLWATDRLTPLRLFVGHLADVHCVGFHPNCNYVLSGSADCSLRMWDVSTGMCVRLLCGHSASVTSLAVSADGRYCASGSADRTVRVWDLGSGRELSCLNGHEGCVWSVAFSHDSPGVLASGGADCAVRIWDVSMNSGGTGAHASTGAGDGARKGARGTGRTEPAAGCTLYTKETPVIRTHFTRRNLLLAAGAYAGR